MATNDQTSILSVVAVVTHGMGRNAFFCRRIRPIGLAYLLMLLDVLVKESQWLKGEVYLIFTCCIVLVSFLLQVCFFQRLWKSYLSNLFLPMMIIYFLLFTIGNFIFYQELAIIVSQLQWVQAILVLIFAFGSIWLLQQPIFRKMNDLPFNCLTLLNSGLVLYYVGILVGWD